MMEIYFTPSTVILLAIILAWVAWAIHRLFKRGMCDCDDHSNCKSCAHCHSGGHESEVQSCKSCKVATDMINNLKHNT